MSVCVGRQTAGHPLPQRGLFHRAGHTRTPLQHFLAHTYGFTRCAHAMDRPLYRGTCGRTQAFALPAAVERPGESSAPLLPNDANGPRGQHATPAKSGRRGLGAAGSNSAHRQQPQQNISSALAHYARLRLAGARASVASESNAAASPGACSNLTGDGTRTRFRPVAFRRPT
jgi:hypothetical protein